MSGILYGVGTGPGDPELMTLKAVRVMKESDMIALPISDTDGMEAPIYDETKQYADRFLNGCVAYQIAYPNAPQIAEKPILYLPMPMCKDKEKLKQLHDACAASIVALLQKEKKVCFLTLGDPTVYSTYLYVHKRVAIQGLEAKIINGIPSFCAAAARMGIGLVENRQQLHVIPSSYEKEGVFDLPGTKVLMKTGKKMAQLKQELLEQDVDFYMVENCGMEQERQYTDVQQVPDQASYYSLIVLKERKEGKAEI